MALIRYFVGYPNMWPRKYDNVESDFHIEFAFHESFFLKFEIVVCNS